MVASTGAPIEFEPLLQERNFGDIRGTAYAELPDVFAPDYAPPGGETWAAFHSRVDAAWLRVQEVAKQADGRLAVITHGLVCRALLMRHLTLDRKDLLGFGFENTSVTEVTATAPWRVVLLGCTQHLDGEEHPAATRNPGVA